MIKKKTTEISEIRSHRSPLLLACCLASASFSSQVHSEVMLMDKNQWQLGANGHIPVFALMSDHDADEDAFRITTGFNPATIQFNVKAPKQEGLDISGMEGIFGTLPSELGTMVALKELDISWTNITGVVPEAVCDLVHEEGLVLKADCDKDELRCCSHS